jgi:hypothetical protein
MLPNAGVSDLLLKIHAAYQSRFPFDYSCMKFATCYIWLFHIHLDGSLRKVFILDYRTVNIVTISPIDY